MRKLALLPLLFAAGCGGGETAANKTEAPAQAARIPAGQWELSSEVTSFNPTDPGAAPVIDTPVGTRATESVCIGDSAETPSAVFTGNGYRCRYGSYYASNGRLSITATCQRDGLTGSIMFASNGTFTADSLEYSRNLRTALAADGDVVINARVTGRRTGACTPAPASAEGETK